MLRQHLPLLITIAGFAQLSVLVASALVPIRLNWRRDLQVLNRLQRQMYWVYGGYVVLSIIAFGLICVFNARELAAGSRLARSMCAYIAVFWGIRLALQTRLDVKSHLTTWWLTAGYHLLSVFFIYFAALFAVATVVP
ncbi:MAG: hypothetical protein L0228_12640 [Planctomycetes bacterium]|nr:hypothetical protein [Planctomycetota bacterium]